uniref:CCHC-type domain-containing protein n=1 Tax=Rhodnius prolixus TaxID=13249 RepID=T1HW26_RHOPR
MRALMSKLDKPLTEEEQISKIYNNLLPAYQGYFRRSEIRTFSDLINLGEEYWSYAERSKSYRPPPPKSDALIPETAYIPPPINRGNKISVPYSPNKPKMTNFQENVKPKLQDGPSYSKDNSLYLITHTQTPAKLKNKTVRLETTTNTSTPEVTKSICWNCGQNGHTYSVCQEKRTRIFCYRCGHPEVTVKSCPTCTLSGSERGVRKERSIRTPTKDPALAPELPETCNLTSDTFGRSLSPPIPKSNFRPVNGCLYIPLNINGQSHDALVDSGSAYSYISLSESKGLPQTHLTTIDRIAVSFANGTQEGRALGTCHVAQLKPYKGEPPEEDVLHQPTAEANPASHSRPGRVTASTARQVYASKEEGV